MRTAGEMRRLQESLDADRAALEPLGRHAARLARFYPETNRLVDSVNSMLKLDAYRRRRIGWARHEPEKWNEFLALRDGEQTYRDSFLYHLGKLVRRVDRAGRHEDARVLDEGGRRFALMASKERSLYRARRDWARLILANAKKAFPYGASNQVEDLARSGGQSFVLTGESRRLYTETPVPADDFEGLGKRTLIAERFGAGNCGEQNKWVATEAFRLLPGAEVTVVTEGKVAHTYTIVGPPFFPESVYVDAWPTRPSVTNYRGYGLRDTPELTVEFSAVADGRHLRDEARHLAGPLPKTPPVQDPVTVKEAKKFIPAELHQYVYSVTWTTDGYNSDSEAEGRGDGRALSSEVFSETAANDFRRPRASASTRNGAGLRRGRPRSDDDAAGSRRTPVPDSRTADRHRRVGRR